jgi:hypothetical protein
VHDHHSPEPVDAGRANAAAASAGAKPSATEAVHVEERRRSEELSPDIIELIASCGESVRRTDRLQRQPREDLRRSTTGQPTPADSSEDLPDAVP